MNDEDMEFCKGKDSYGKVSSNAFAHQNYGPIQTRAHPNAIERKRMPTHVIVNASKVAITVAFSFLSGLCASKLPFFDKANQKQSAKARVERVAKRCERLRKNEDKHEDEAYVACRGEARTYPVHSSNTALVIIDMQTDFLSSKGRLGKNYDESVARGMERTIENVSKLLKKCREKGITVAHSRSHRYGASVRRDLLLDVDVLKGSPIEGVDETYNFVEACKPVEGEIIVDKWTFGAFASTDLEERLLERGVERILLCGILTNVCVIATAVQAVDRFFRVCLVEDCCGAFGAGWHEKAVELINGPQIAKVNHHKSVGLYFGEVAGVEETMKGLECLL
tara:strand:+ start:5005 stop:6015 length:1011 start_codon:yes stop_codon:yes gene_type:complete